MIGDEEEREEEESLQQLQAFFLRLSYWIPQYMTFLHVSLIYPWGFEYVDTDVNSVVVNAFNV